MAGKVTLASLYQSGLNRFKIEMKGIFMTQTIRILSYRYDKILNRSIPDKTKVESDSIFTLKEIADIIRAALIMSNPDQTRKVK